MLNATVLNAIMINVVVLSVMAPKKGQKNFCFFKTFFKELNAKNIKEKGK
jgi:hypothetical protein